MTSIIQVRQRAYLDLASLLTGFGFMLKNSKNATDNCHKSIKNKNCYVVCGPEGSGSVFVAQVISFATGHCDFFGRYSGYGYNSESACENLVLHRSLPYMRPKKFQDSLVAEIAEFSDMYERVNYVLATRDKSCSIFSKTRRFGGTLKEAEMDYVAASPFFAQLANDDNCFIWSYESMLLLGKPYFLRMYRFFGIKSQFFPEIYDGNASYFTRG